MPLWMLNVTTVSGTVPPVRRQGEIVAPGTTTAGGPVGGAGVLLDGDTLMVEDDVDVGTVGVVVGSPESRADAHQASESATRVAVASSATSPWVRRLMGPFSRAAGYGRAMRGYVGIAAVALLVTGCTDDASSRAPAEPTATSAATTAAEPTSPATAEPTAEPTSEPIAEPTSEPADPSFSSARAMRTVRFLADEVGPRLATGPAFHRSARWVERRFEALGFDLSLQSFPVPAGDSWGVPVEAGTSVNVVARPRGLGPRSPYLLVGAHLDTVAVAPGAEDNASGIAVLLETARRWAVAPGHLPVVFVAFGGEEPRGPGDLEHHFGSLHYVAGMSPAERRHLRGMVAMDRVGVGELVPVGSVGGTPTATRAALVRSAAGLGIGVVVDPDNTASDHESFADAGLPAARLGSTPYAAYHSAEDEPAVVDGAQLRRVGRVIWDWLLRAR
jgi:aminopeptidase YwaD